ncbi:Uncharacterised protein [Shigella sonnei]|nr:Uncharacterised protein [Shigella sonnei]CSQ70633.1 Uncharacterised protein [Shigella sonnei]CSR28427.1 Uncharacterised protein [Shigella sonnei]
MENVSTSVAAPSSWTSERSSNVSTLPALCWASFCLSGTESFAELAFSEEAALVTSEGASFFTAVGALSLLSHPASASISMQAATRNFFIFHPCHNGPLATSNNYYA